LKEKRLNYEGLKMIKKYLFRGGKFSLKVKFILVVVLLTAILLVSFSYLASSSIYGMGQRSQDISADALEDQAGEYLMQVTRDNAQKNDQMLSSILGNAQNLASYATEIFESPEIFVPGEYWDAEEHMFFGPEGQYKNSASEAGSAFVPNFIEINDEAVRDLESGAYMDFVIAHVGKDTPNIVAIYLSTEREVTRYYPNIDIVSVVPPDFQVTQRPWYLSANVENNPERNVVWSPVYVDVTGQGLMVTAVAPVYINGDELLGGIGIDVTLEAITLNMETAKLPGGGYLLLIDNSGYAIVLPEEGYNDLMGRPSEEGEFAPDVMSEARPEFTSFLDNIATEENGFTTVEINGTEMFIAFSKMNNTGWTLASIVKAENILQSITKLQDEMHGATNALIFGSILPMSFVILLIAIIVGSLLTSHMVAPIQRLSEAAQQVAMGKWNDIEMDDHNSEDEIGQLSNSFTFMLSELKKSRAELEEYSINLESMVEDRTKELDEKIVKLEESDAANLSILEDLNETIGSLEKAEKEIKNKNMDLKKAHEGLSSLNKNLERKVKGRTAEVEKLLKQKDEFIGQLGHDLKNPLGPLINLLPILEEDEADPERKEIFEVLNRNVSHMKNLVTKTIQLARLNSPSTKFSVEDTNLLSEVDDVIEKSKLLFEENNIEVENNIGKDIMVKADKLRLTELFDNLIDNSVKYSPDGGKITIDAEKNVTVSVKDTGMGITKEQLNYIFDEFYKADVSRHDFDSSGLGMPIAKRIVEKHGGRIWAESQGLGKGTTMFFTIPSSSKD
jgi:signal transduction histidine kinase/HAMP domain-containing protein